METSGIQWTDATFNPWWGCVKVSPACTHCYAETFARRVGKDVWGPNAPRRFFADKHWNEPVKWDAKAAKEGRRRTRVFCASMADVFEDRDDLIPHRARLFDLIERTPNLDWLLLTKRTDMVMHMVPVQWETAFPANVWMGTTVEDQKRADERIPHLLRVPARVRFLSMEPLFESVDLAYACFNGTDSFGTMPGLHWVIAGCESRGSAAGRPTKDEWLRSLRDQCAMANVPFFLKQTAIDGKIEHAPTLDGVEHLSFPK